MENKTKMYILVDTRTCGSCHDCLDKGLLQAEKPLHLGILVVMLKLSPS